MAKLKFDMETLIKEDDMIKNLLFLLLSIFSLSSNAMAITLHPEDLKIANLSDINLSFAVEGRCWTEIGSIQNHTSIRIPRNLLNQTCQANPTNCTFIVYGEENCKGNKFQKITLDVNGWGVIALEGQAGSKVNVYGDGFNIYFENSGR